MHSNGYQVRYEDYEPGNPGGHSQPLTDSDLSLEEAFGLVAELEAESFLDDVEEYGPHVDRSQGYTVTPGFWD